MFALRLARSQSNCLRLALYPNARQLSASGIPNVKLQEDIDKPKEIRIPMPFGHIAGKWWGPMNGRPMLALHGWQDNAGSFDKLIPLLPANMSVLAMDLPGHGLSSQNPPGAYYHFIDIAVVMRRIVKYFNWKSVSLLSHSLGSTAAYVYAASFPTEVDRFITLDILRPFVISNSKHVNGTGNAMDRFLELEMRMESDGAPTYTYEQIIQLTIKGSNGSLTPESADILLKRGAERIKEQNGEIRYKLIRDPRVKCHPLLRPSHELNLDYAKRFTCPVLYIKANEGIPFESKKLEKQTMDVLRESCNRVGYHEIPGTHHVHLNNPGKSVTSYK